MTGISQYLLIGSLESYSGKSASLLGIGAQLKKRGWDIAYGKPLSTGHRKLMGKGMDEDGSFIAQILELPSDRLYPTLISMDCQTIEERLTQTNPDNPQVSLAQHYPTAPDRLVLLEGPGTLDEGRLFGLSLAQMADQLSAGILLVISFEAQQIIDQALSAKERLGDRLLGIVVNDITEDFIERFPQDYVPYLESQGIPILGQLPRSNLLRSISVRELVDRLEATVLCRSDRLDLMVESLRIGAMNVNSALKYFRKGQNMAVVTGGDRTDIQLAALETSTQCLILTGHLSPSELIISRADELEIPILTVDLDTLTTVEIIDNAFGTVPLHEPVKVKCISELIAAHFDLDRLLGYLA
ncbi:MAG: phosphotransacetylase family protein [Roseofilum sp. SID2]|uniref:phosphotransacetylase family protein n=1 Tax=unclassified Roseofilum TaxID=2620099 RepID=UPI001B10443B|nr:MULTISPECIES: phosphotransacetylase family protein [unclassified Roseofilum]MBP0011551.1 phosphotransacetylase family protein [Roseofilum sp. SID3]MBP0025730.1 phosphotransacetylase family protein [Roseofilum sp. SID2]